MNSHDFYTRPDNYDFEFERQMIDRLQPRVPNRVFDSHFHISVNEIRDVPDDKAFDTWRECTEYYLGKGNVKGGLLMCHPRKYKTKEILDQNNHLACSIAEEREGFVSGLVLRPEGTATDADKFISKYRKITTLKPYRNYALAENAYEADITTFAPEWMWELANHYGMCMVIHISHYRDLLSDPGTGGQIRYLCKKYPNVKVDLAHCALGHNPHKMKLGLHYLEGLDNVWMDTGGVGEALSIIYAFKSIGFDKVMYASDGFNYAFGNASRCFSVGGHFLALCDSFGQLDLPPDYQYKPVNAFAENMLATFAAGDVCELTDTQWQDFFYGNAAKLHYPLIRK